MSILAILGYGSGGRIFDVALSADKKTIEFEEACDMYFSVGLDKTKFGLLIDELKELHEQMID